MAFTGALRRLGQVWGIRDFSSRATVRVTSRLTRSWGRAHPERGDILLHPSLLSASAARQRAVLVHEAAHVAAFVLYGASARPHGPQWKDLVVRAGGVPSTRLRGPAVPVARKAFRYLHRCPVCQMTRLARRRMSRWRCAQCREDHLDGHLLITRVD